MEIVIIFLALLVLILTLLLVKKNSGYKRLQTDYTQHKNESDKKLYYYYNEFKDIVDKNKEIAERQEKINLINRNISELQQKYENGLITYKSLEHEISLYNETLDLREYGLYEPQYNFDTSDDFKAHIDANYHRQKESVKSGSAIYCPIDWEVSGSKSEGKKMMNRYQKLMLFAFNGECEGLIAKVKWNNASKIQERIYKTYESINKLGSVVNMTITKEFLDLKYEEFKLTYEYEMKKYEEKEEQRRLREQMREEERVQKELEKAQRDAETEERNYYKALEQAKEELSHANQFEMDHLNFKIRELEQKLQEAQANKARAISMAQQTKVGHIYVISNIGSFGEEVYKIGSTRRLDPHDRVKELGDASVPFHFDVHAIIYSENAPQLEFEIHRNFNERRINRVNQRKEFFRISLEEIEEFVNRHTNASIQFTKLAEAKEYRETLSILEQINKVMEGKESQNFPSSIM